MKTRMNQVVFAMMFLGGALCPLSATIARAIEPSSIPAEMPPLPQVPLTIEHALALAVSRQPDLEALRRRVAIAEANALQAGLWPNPVIEAAVEGYTPGGVGPESNKPDQQQRVVSLSQTLPLSGVPGKARAAARVEVDRLRAELEVLTGDLRASVRTAFCMVLGRQKALEEFETLSGTLGRTLELARARREAGEIAGMEVIKAEANFERYVMEIDAARNELDAARAQLALLLGAPDAPLPACAGDLEEMGQPIDWDAVSQKIASHPREEAWRFRMRKTEADLKAARAARVPDLTFSVGYRRYDATEQDTWDFRMGFEIPLFDRNQGAIRAAREDAAREEAAILSERNQVRERLQTLRSAHESRGRRIHALRDRVLPKMEESLAIAETAFAAGETGMLEVLDAHRSLSEAKLAYIEELAALRVVEGEVARLTGGPGS